LKTLRFVTILNSLQVLVLLAVLVSGTPVQAATYVGAFSWKQLPGGDVVDISVGANGDTWIVGGGYAAGHGYLVHKWDAANHKWLTYSDGRGVRIDVAPDGTPWIVTEAGSVYRREGGAWVELPTENAIDIAIGPLGEIWALADVGVQAGHEVIFWDGRAFQIQNGSGKRLDVHPNGTPYVVGDDGTLWRGVPGGFEQVPGEAINDISIGVGQHMWVTAGSKGSGGYSIRAWNGSVWELSTGEGLSIAVHPDGLPWVTASGGSVWRSEPGKQVPNVFEQMVGDARANLDAAGLGIKVRYEYISNRPDLQNRVVGQHPPAGDYASDTVQLTVYRNNPPPIEGPCTVFAQGEDGGQTSTKQFDQWLFPSGFSESYKGSTSWTDVVTDVFAGDFNSLTDPAIWLMLVDFAGDPLAVVEQTGINALLDSLGMPTIPQISINTVLGAVPGVNLNNYMYTKSDLLQAMLLQTGLVDRSGWSLERWNDSMTRVWFKGACTGAYVELWKDSEGRGAYMSLAPGSNVVLPSGFYKEVSTLQVVFPAPQ
jgi:PASTA domain